MTEDHRVSEVVLLIEQKKYSDAERILKDLLSHDPNNIHFLSLLAEIHIQNDRFAAARQIVDNAIGLSPDTAHLFYMKSRIALAEEQYDDAEANLNEAIQRDPYDADYFAFFSQVKLMRKDLTRALELADRALAIDSENLLALNSRSTALLKLDRKEESFNTIKGALREDPNNAYTHANYGWGLLEKGDHRKALEHFREALKNDPSYVYAQAGMVEALKATNPVYRLFLKYAFFMGNLTAKYQWAVILGFYFGVRFLRSVAAANEALQPFLIPVIIVLTLVAFSTWIIEPVSNLFLRFNRFGQFLLDKKEKMSSNFVAGSFALFTGGLLGYFILSDERFLALAVFGFAMMVPLGVMFSPSKYKHALLIYASIMAGIGMIAIALTFSSGELFNLFTVVFLFGFVAFQFLANFIMIKQANR
jgi:tetratricopeptide (TPR) repeat protein